MSSDSDETNKKKDEFYHAALNMHANIKPDVNEANEIKVCFKDNK